MPVPYPVCRASLDEGTCRYRMKVYADNKVLVEKHMKEYADGKLNQSAKPCPVVV